MTITLEPEEKQALQQMCAEDYRPPKDQLLYLLRLEAQKRGLWGKVFGANNEEQVESTDKTQNDTGLVLAGNTSAVL